MIVTRALARPAGVAVALSCLATFALSGCDDQSKGTTEPPTTGQTTSTAEPSSTASSTVDPSTVDPSTADPSTPDPSSADPSTADPSAEPTQPTTTTATASPTASSTGGVDPSAGLRGRLLRAADMPGFNEEFRWATSSTRLSEPSDLFGTCQRFEMTSVGATRVAVRTYRPAVGDSLDRAGELVAEFPDSTTARRAFAVLKSWRGQCGDRLRRFDRSKIGALKNVSVSGGTGGWYLLTYGVVPGDPVSQYFDAQGMAVVGARIALVELILGGQDYNYPPGQEPAVAAVQRAAARLS